MIPGTGINSHPEKASIAGRWRKSAEAAVVRALEIEEQPSDSARLACLACLRIAIEAWKAFPCPETAFARDAAARAYLKANGIAPEALGPLQIVRGSRR